MTERSRSLSAPGLLRIARGVLILPTSCTEAAVRILATCSRDRPMPRAMASACRATRLEWPCVYESRASSPDASVFSSSVRRTLLSSPCPSSCSTRVRRRSARMRRSQPHTMRSPKTMSREPGRRIQSAEPARAKRIDCDNASTTESTPPSPSKAWTAEAISAGSPTTAKVATATCGRYRVKGIAFVIGHEAENLYGRPLTSQRSALHALGHLKRQLGAGPPATRAGILSAHAPDVVCLQETKSEPAAEWPAH